MPGGMRSNLRIIGHLANRNFAETIFSPGVYLTLSLIVAGASLVILSYRNAVRTESIMVFDDPFTPALVVATILAAIYLGIASCTSTAREKESGTLLILFTGPVNRTRFILGLYFSQVLALLFILLVLLADFLLVAQLTRFYVSPQIALKMLYAVIAISGVIMLGIFLATFTGKTRTAVLAFIMIVFAGILLQGLDIFLYTPQMQATNGNLFLVGKVIHIANSAIRWISPFSYLNQGFEALMVSDWASLAANAGASLLFSAVFFALSVKALGAKGVRPE